MSPDYECPDLLHILIDRLGSAVSLKQLCLLRRFERKRRRREKKRGFKRKRQFQNPAASFGIRSIMSQNLWSKSIDRFLQQMSGVQLRNVQYNRTSHPRFQPRRVTERPLCFCPLRGSTFRAVAREAVFFIDLVPVPPYESFKGVKSVTWWSSGFFISSHTVWFWGGNILSVQSFHLDH